MTDRELKYALDSNSVAGPETGPALFKEHFERVIASKAKPSTKTLYAQTLLKVLAFDGRELGFGDITYSWLKEFEKYCISGGLSVNSVNIHMRNIRAVINDAINEDKAPLDCYPFRKFKIRSEQTRHRALSVEQLRQLRDYPCEPYQRQYRDMFMLIFYLGGINIGDLCNLREMREGYIEYRCAKTGRLYRIKVKPEAQAIIDRYRGRNYLLEILDRYGDYRNYMHRLNRNLSEIGTVWQLPGRGGKKKKTGLFPELSTCRTRHTPATVAASLDIPRDTIAAILGHGGHTVTDIYIAYDQHRVDRAMRQIIDCVNGESSTL
jgi:integrase